MPTTNGLSALFGLGGTKAFLPNLSGGINGANPAPTDQRTAFAGGLSNVGAPVQGNMLGPQTNPGQSTELLGHHGFSGYYPMPSGPPVPGPGTLPPETWFQHPTNITQLQPFKQTGPAVNVADKVAASMGPPKPPEPTHTYSTEGEWGGGISGGAGAPQQFGQTWLQSYNCGNTWSPQYGTKGTVGQAPAGNWTQLNNGGSSPQWIQRG